MLKLHHLGYFIAVAEELHFGRAAERLQIAQPPLSQQIRRLETELQVRLLYRTKRRVELTDAGRVFLEEARAILAQTERALHAVRRADRGEIGRLALGAVSSADPNVLTQVLRTFGKRFPGVEVALHTLSTTAQIRALHERRIDVGLLRQPVKDDVLVIESISREPLVVALPTKHPLGRHGKVPLRALGNEPHIMFPRHLAPGYYDVIVTLFRQADLRFHVVQETEHFQTILALVAGGFGVFLLPASMQTVRRKGVVYRALRDRVPEVETAVAYRPDDRRQVLQAFLDVVRDVCHTRSRTSRLKTTSASSPVQADDTQADVRASEGRGVRLQSD